jgi:hypothetical protein
MPVIPVLRRLRQEDQESEASLVSIAIPCLKSWGGGRVIWKRNREVKKGMNVQVHCMHA